MREMKDSGVEWIGTMPQEWDTIHFWQAIKRMGTGLNPRDNFVLTKDDALFYVTIRNFKDGRLFLDDNCDRISQEAFDIIQDRSNLKKGDILFASISKDGQAYIIDENPKNWNINESVFCIRVNERYYSSRFFYYILINDAFYSSLRIDATGTTFQSIKQNQLRKSIIIHPPIEEQERIADYLEQKCSAIDTAIAKQEQIVERLKAYKLSLITEAVTRGLDPNAEMKDSGVGMCPMLPRHWQVMQIRYLFSLREERNYKELNEVRLLSLYTDLGVFPHGEQEERGNKAVTADGYKIVHEDDIIVNIILAWMGAIGRSAYDGVTSPAYDIYKPYDRVCSRFFHYLFRTKAFSGECYKYGRGIMAMRWRTYSNEFKSIRIPVPPYDEQIRIADYLDMKGTIIDKTIHDREKAIEKLNAYKKSLIYEVVTGKKEV